MSKKEIALRLRAAREAAGLKQEDVAITLGVKPQTISNYERAVSRVDTDALMMLCDLYNVSVMWILSGEETGIPHECDTASWSQPLTDAYAAAPELTQRSACNVLEIPHVKAPAAPKRRRQVSKVVYDSPAAAGQPAYIEDSYERVDFPADEVPTDADYGVRITGCSMEPDIKEGDIVWVASGSEVLSGQIGIFMLGDEAVCKRARYDNFGRLVKLESDNPECDDIDLREYAETDIELRISGRVVGVYHEE